MKQNSSRPPAGNQGPTRERAVATKTIPATTVTPQPQERRGKWRPSDIGEYRKTHGLVCVPLTHTDPLPDVVKSLRWNYQLGVGGFPGGVWKLADVRQWLRFRTFGVREFAEVRRLMPVINETIALIVNDPKNGVRVVELP